MKRKTVLAWHFVKDDGTNRLGVKEKVGKWYRVEGEIVPCANGLHGSVRLIDALKYSPGAVLRRTEHRGTIVEHDGEKIASSERRVLWQIDATKLLHEFACRCAEGALKAEKVTDERCWNAIKVKRAWLAGKATDEELSAANAACNAAQDAANAACYAAKSAAHSAAYCAAYCAAQDAAYAAYCAAQDVANAAYCAACNAAKSAQNKRLTSMVMRAHRESR